MPLGNCTVCGEMVYDGEGEDMSTDPAVQAYEHFDCEA